RCKINGADSRVLCEPPYTEPYVRWCGRTGAARLPPTRCAYSAPASEKSIFSSLSDAAFWKHVVIRPFWSVRMTRDIRLIVHKTEASLLLCYVNHHDEAYRWAERRKLETHPKTGAAQLVEIRETVKEVVVPLYVQTARTAEPRPVAE